MSLALPQVAEIEQFSVVYFDHITAFEALQHKTFVRGGPHTCSATVSSVHEFTQHI